MDITSLEENYRNGISTPTQVVRDIYAQIRLQGERPVWITLVNEADSLARAAALERMATPEDLPLYGIPFAVKDNFDVAGLQTSAACPEYSHEVTETAEAVIRLLAAGAILIGKTNMDQFATGLVGTRSPYGVCSSVFDKRYISGGSSSGSAVAVANGLASFSLGTDTAGSGRVPAALNQLVGMKPTRGVVSTSGVVPACHSLDCVSIFAETCSDAARVLRVLCGPDEKDAYSRTNGPSQGAAPWVASAFRFGVPTDESLEFFGDAEAHASYLNAVAALEKVGGETIRFDYEIFRRAADLLYSGPWVAERLAALQDFANCHADAFEPTVGQIILSAGKYSAVDAFRGEYVLMKIRKEATAVMDCVDFLLLPTVPTTYTIAEVAASPLQLNTNLGYYTNFVNLLDMAAVAVPAGLKADGLPFGVSLIGKAFTDDALLTLGDRLHRLLATKLGGSERLLEDSPPLVARATPPGCILMAVVGAHLTDMPLNWQMTERRARLVRTVRTSQDYRLYVLPNSTPAKPGLIYEPGFGGKGIELEVWAMPEDSVGTFLDNILAPLCLGKVNLEDGSSVNGFLCEPAGIVGAHEITHLGGWRAYTQSAAN